MVIAFKKKLLKRILKSDIVSFDIFDTLVKRNVKTPVDVFELIERQYNIDYHDKIANFKENRIEAEKKARIEIGNNIETIEEIYEFLPYDELKKKRLIELENEIEIAICQKNLQLFDIYNFCKSNNKKIICTSDMYLPKKTINQILKNSEYDIDEIYISCELRKSKRNRSLFKFLKEKYRGRKIIHIGDSKKSDFLNPILTGIESYKIKNYVNNCVFVNPNTFNNLSSNIVFSYVNNNVLKSENQFYRLGYEIFGPLLLAFCQWIHMNAKKDDIRNLFFCARDMQFVQKIYNIVYKENAIPNEYFYISRKSIEKPFLFKCNSFEDFVSTIPKKKMHIVEILKNKNISLDSNINLFNYELDSSKKYNIYDLKKHDGFKKFYSEIIRENIISDTVEQYDFFMDYLDSIGFDPKHTALIDLGWKGTIQYSLMRIFNLFDMKGYYLGIEKNCFNELNDSNSKGYLFERLAKKNDYEEKSYSFRTLFEIFFLANHGSTLKYASEKNNFVIFDNFDDSNYELVSKIQEGAQCFAEDISLVFDKFIYEEIEISSIFESLLKIGIKPKMWQAEMFGDFSFDNMISGKLAKPDKRIRYVLNPKKLYIDVMNSEWMVGFLKRLFIVDFPYYKVYMFLKKIRDSRRK